MSNFLDRVGRASAHLESRRDAPDTSTEERQGINTDLEILRSIGAAAQPLNPPLPDDHADTRLEDVELRHGLHTH